MVGVCVALQPVVNAGLARYSHPLVASTISFLIGTVLLIALSLLLVPGAVRKLTWTSLAQVPPVYYSGGLIGAVIVVAMTRLVPELGAVRTLALSISGQIVFGLITDQFGLFGLRPVPVTGGRLAGVVLLLVGTHLALRR